MNENTKDILIRAGKTFWQAALAYLLADAAVLQQHIKHDRARDHAKCRNPPAQIFIVGIELLHTL